MTRAPYIRREFVNVYKKVSDLPRATPWAVQHIPNAVIIGRYKTWAEAMDAANNYVDNETERRAGNG